MLQSNDHSTIGAALAGEALKPANCFRMNGSRSPEEGILLELDHPKVGGKPALFVGGRFIFRNYQNGCIYKPQGRAGIVRRAVIEWKEPVGKRPFPVLTQPNDPNPPLLLHVSTHQVLPENVRLNVKFSRGVLTEGRVIDEDYGEMLIALDDNQSADVFYIDGAVKRVIRTGSDLVGHELSLDDQAEARIARNEGIISVLNEEFRKSFGHPPEDLIRQRDAAFHDLISVMDIGGRRSASIGDRIFDILVTYGKEGDLRAGTVRSRAMEVLKRVNPGRVMEFEEACLPSVYAHQLGFNLATSGPSAQSRKGPTADRKAKLAARAARDSQARAQMRGASGGGKPQGKSKK